MQRHPNHAVGLAALLLGLPAHGQPAAPPTDAPPAADPTVQDAPQAPSDTPPPGPTSAEAEDKAKLEQRVTHLEAQLHELSSQLESEELDRLVQDAQSEAQAAELEEAPEQREFLAGSLALQKLNPELTVSGDVLAALVVDGSRFYATEHDRSGLLIRGLGLHLQHVLDPYSMFKSALHFSPEHGVGPPH